MLDKKKYLKFLYNLKNSYVKKYRQLFYKKNKVKRLTVVNQFFSPDYAATGQLLGSLSKNLALENDFKIEVLTGFPSYAYNCSKVKKIEKSYNRIIKRSISSSIWPKKYGGRLVNSLLFTLNIGFKLVFMQKRSNIIIFTSEPPFLAFIALLIKFLTRTPYIILIYDLYPDILLKLNYIKKDNKIFNLWNKFNFISYKHANEIIVLSNSMKDKLFKNFPLLKTKVNVISSWADHEQIKPLSKNLNWFAKKYNLEKSFVVLYSGNQGRCHDLITIIDAALLLKSNKGIKFLFIGKGPQNKKIKDLARKLFLDNCIFLPYQKFEDLKFSLTSADLALVSLNKNAEGLVAPSKLYGHLASGTPIALISPSGSYLKELVENRSLGKWFDNGSSNELANWIKVIKRNENLRKDISKNCREYLIKEASLQIIKNKYLDVIQRNF
tara:strand:- start:40938 stop:42251 length:1314 start_codon:yes stop_codon:yes gene_type:complete